MYSFFRPAPPLQPYIQNYWMLSDHQAQDTPLHEQIFVDGQVDIIFNFGVAYRRTNQHDSMDLVSESNLDTHRSYPVAIYQSGRVDLVGVRFKPGGLSPFLAIPMHQLSNQVLHLSLMFRRSAHELEAKLYDAALDRQKQVQMLDHFFLNRLNVQPAQQLISTCIGQIARSNGTLAIVELSHQVGYSIRTLDRLFRQHVGFSPKWYARVARLHHALETLIRDDVIDLASVAFRVGYYDQAHFSKDFKAFTGQTPSEYRQQLQARRTQPPPNLVQFLQDEQRHTS